MGICGSNNFVIDTSVNIYLQINSKRKSPKSAQEAVDQFWNVEGHSPRVKTADKIKIIAGSSRGVDFWNVEGYWIVLFRVKAVDKIKVIAGSSRTGDFWNVERNWIVVSRVKAWIKSSLEGY